VTKAAVYVRVSTDEQAEHGHSIDEQERLGREFIQEHDWSPVDVFRDPGYSGATDDRPGLQAMLSRLDEIDVIVVWAMDRLTRDVELFAKLAKVLTAANVRIQSLTSTVDLTTPEGEAMAGVAAVFGQFERKRIAERVRAGLRGRRESGRPVGRVPIGYTVEKNVADGQVATERVIDPTTVKVVERIFDLVESGATFGEVAKILNTEGITGKLGKPFVSKSVSTIIHNTAYKGGKNYPVIIDGDRFDAIQANLKRLDPVMVAKRKRGRRPKDESFFLRGIARCLCCGSTLYCRSDYAVGRVYVCRHRLLGTGVCSAPAIPAELIENHVRSHLDGFVDDLGSLLTEVVNRRDSDRQVRKAALQRQRGQLEELGRKRGRHFARYVKLADDGDPEARLAAEVVDQIDGELDDLRRRIEDAEAFLSEHDGPPDLDAGLDAYSRLRDDVHGVIEKAEDARQLNDRLSTVLCGLWAKIEVDTLLIEFELVKEREFEVTTELGDEVFKYSYGELPPRHLDGTEQELRDTTRLRKTGNQTSV
jgi:site-specific DNA recombinase